jgi:hypothetical protein
VSPAKPNKTLMRSIGEFFGHIVRGVRTPADEPDPPDAHVLRREVEEQSRDTPAGRVTLRRTTVEELRIEPMEGRDAT